MLHGLLDLRPAEQVLQLADCRLRLGELGLEPAEMLRDQLLARVGIGRGEHGLQLGDRHVEVAKPADPRFHPGSIGSPLRGGSRAQLGLDSPFIMATELTG